MTDKDVMKMYPEFVERMTCSDAMDEVHVPLQHRYGEPIQINQVRKLKRAISGMVNEAGELNQIIHKAAYRGHDLDLNELTKEASDVMFHVQQFCNAIGITLDELIAINVRKLTARYPDGYDPDLDKNRTDRK